MSCFMDVPSNFHPFACDGRGKCVHCDRASTENHHPDVCALCDPEYDMQPNPAWDERLEHEARLAAKGRA